MGAAPRHVVEDAHIEPRRPSIGEKAQEDVLLVEQSIFHEAPFFEPAMRHKPRDRQRPVGVGHGEVIRADADLRDGGCVGADEPRADGQVGVEQSRVLLAPPARQVEGAELGVSVELMEKGRGAVGGAGQDFYAHRIVEHPARREGAGGREPCTGIPTPWIDGAETVGVEPEGQRAFGGPEPIDCHLKGERAALCLRRGDSAQQDTQEPKRPQPTAHSLT